MHKLSLFVVLFFLQRKPSALPNDLRPPNKMKDCLHPPARLGPRAPGGESSDFSHQIRCKISATIQALQWNWRVPFEFDASDGIVGLGLPGNAQLAFSRGAEPRILPVGSRLSDILWQVGKTLVSLLIWNWILGQIGTLLLWTDVTCLKMDVQLHPTKHEAQMRGRGCWTFTATHSNILIK